MAVALFHWMCIASSMFKCWLTFGSESHVSWWIRAASAPRVDVIVPVIDRYSSLSTTLEQDCAKLLFSSISFALPFPTVALA
jgi:hypothetical protein